MNLNPSSETLAASFSLTYSEQLSCCAQCEKPVFNFQVHVEYEDVFYHEECFGCKICSKPFSARNYNQINGQSLISLSSMICKTKQNQLFCVQDFITSELKCKICAQHFQLDSQIYPLDEGDRLVHMECVKCSVCSVRIDSTQEYSLKEDSSAGACLLLTCKHCTLAQNKFESDSLAKRKKQKVSNLNKHRLSSRQKQLLRSKFVSVGFNPTEFLDEKNELVLNDLAKDIGCSKNALSNYIDRHKTKLNELIKKGDRNGKQMHSIESMLDELKKLDKILAPNQSPFGEYKKCASKDLSALLEMEKMKNISPPNRCPFGSYIKSTNSSSNSIIIE